MAILRICTLALLEKTWCFTKKEVYAIGETYEIVARIKGHDKERDSGLPIKIELREIT